MTDRRAFSNLKIGRLATAAVLCGFIACAAGDSSEPRAPRIASGDAIAPEDIRYVVSCHGVLCAFDASSSFDPAGIVKWEWHWGDGTSVVRAAPTAKKLYANPGIYDITLTVTNSLGQSASTTRQDTLLAEPLGMTKLAENSFDCITGCAPGWIYWDQNYPDAASLVPDVNAPKSGPGVVRQIFTPALPGGSSPATISTKLPHRQTIYVALWLQLSQIYEAHPSTVNKVLHFWTKNGRNTIIFILRGGGNDRLVPGFLTQGMSAPYQGSTEVNFDAPPDACTTVRGRWHRYEMILSNNTPGAPDGQAQLWMDGRKCLSVSGLTYVGAGQNNKWEDIWWSPTWGGVGGSVFAPFYQAVDHIYISGK